MGIESHDAARAHSGCVRVDLSQHRRTLSLDSNACNMHQCPPCFIFTGAGRTLFLRHCSSMKVSNKKHMGGKNPEYDPFQHALQQFVFVNTDPSSSARICDGTLIHELPYDSSATAFCYSGGADRLYFSIPVALLPTRYSLKGNSSHSLRI